MAESTGDRTEEATPQRIRKSREDGRVPQSNEIPHALAVGALFLALLFAGTSIYQLFSRTLQTCLSSQMAEVGKGISLVNLFLSVGSESLTHLIPFMLAGFISAISGGLLVGGWAFAPKAIQPKIERISIIKGMKNLLSVKSVVNLMVSLAKLGFMAVVLWILR